MSEGVKYNVVGEIKLHFDACSFCFYYGEATGTCAITKRVCLSLVDILAIDFETRKVLCKEFIGSLKPKSEEDMEERFIEIGDGIVQDSKTGLEWAGPFDPLSQDEAVLWAEEALEGGYIDWRIPTIEELLDLLDFAQDNIAGGLQERFLNGNWSSSVVVGLYNSVWVLDLEEDGLVVSCGVNFVRTFSVVRKVND